MNDDLEVSRQYVIKDFRSFGGIATVHVQFQASPHSKTDAVCLATTVMCWTSNECRIDVKAANGLSASSVPE